MDRELRSEREARERLQLETEKREERERWEQQQARELEKMKMKEERGSSHICNRDLVADWEVQMAQLEEQVERRLNDPRLRPPAWEYCISEVLSRFPPNNLSDEAIKARLVSLQTIAPMSKGNLEPLLTMPPLTALPLTCHHTYL